MAEEPKPEKKRASFKPILWGSMFTVAMVAFPGIVILVIVGMLPSIVAFMVIGAKGNWSFILPFRGAKIWSMATNMKSLNWSSGTGLMPMSAAPTDAPMIADSLMGVSRTRFAPNSSISPRVTDHT